MIKCKIKHGKAPRARIKGTLPDLTKETCALIHMVYHGIKKRYPKVADEYKERLIVMLLASDSPVRKSYEGEDTSHEN